MGVKRKGLYITAVLFIGLLILHACTSSYDSITGQLQIVTYGQSMGDGDPLETAAVSPLKIPETLLTEFMREKIKVPVSMEPEFVPDEIIVKYKSGLEPADIQSFSTFSAFIEYRSNRDVADGVRTVLKLAEYERASLSLDAVRDRTLREIEWLNTLPHVEYAQPNYIYRPLALAAQPNDEHYYMQWHYPLIKWDHVWDENLVTNLNSVTVAVIDTGIMRENWDKDPGLNHEDFGGSGSTPFVDEYDFIANPNLSFDGDGRDDDATDMGDNPDLSLASFHGTHVMGTIGALTNNSTGVAGMAGRGAVGASVQIMPLRALGYGGGTTVDIVEAIEYASKTGIYEFSPHTKADIINMSLGGTGQDQNLKDAVDAAYYDEGIVIVAAAGNTGSNVAFYPASYASVISVSAVDIGANIASYSNFGSSIDVAAPGGDLSYNLNFDIDALKYPDGVLSTFTRVIDNGSVTADTATYAFNQGTSMATPHVAGLAALIKAANPGLAAAQIRSIIENNAIDLGSPGRDDFYGRGLINAYASVHDALGTAPVDQNPVLFSNPKLFKLQGTDPSATITLKNIGDTSSNITINSITKENSASWLTVTPPSGPVTGTGVDATIDIDSSSIADGSTYIEMLNIIVDQSGVADEHVYVMYNVNGFPLEGLFDIGALFVVAIDFDTGKIAAVDATTISTKYNYNIQNLSSGSYIIGASTDHDDDGEIFESDDAYGFYMSSTQVIVVEVTAGEVEDNINFQVIDQFDNPTGQASLLAR